MEKKKMIKTLCEQIMMVSFGILVAISIEEIVNYMLGNSFSLQWYITISIIIVSVLGCLPNLILYSSWGNKKIRIAIHFILEFAVVMGGGYLFQWYTNALYFGITAASMTVIYCMVWVGSTLLYRYDERRINMALDALRDED